MHKETGCGRKVSSAAGCIERHHVRAWRQHLDAFELETSHTALQTVNFIVSFMQNGLCRVKSATYLMVKRHMGMERNIQQKYRGAFVSIISGSVLVYIHTVCGAHRSEFAASFSS